MSILQKLVVEAPPKSPAIITRRRPTSTTSVPFREGSGPNPQRVINYYTFPNE